MNAILSDIHRAYPMVTRYAVLRATREVVLAVQYENRAGEVWARILYPNGAASWVAAGCLSPHLPFVFFGWSS
jgi:hypothetical protein